MDIGFSEEQELLRETARRFLQHECGSQFVRQRMAELATGTDEFWQKLAEQGWRGIVYPEKDGGSGLGLVDLVVLMEEMGRAVMPGPFLSTVLLEHDLQLYSKRAKSCEVAFGDGTWHRERVAQLMRL